MNEKLLFIIPQWIIDLNFNIAKKIEYLSQSISGSSSVEFLRLTNLQIKMLRCLLIDLWLFPRTLILSIDHAEN